MRFAARLLVFLIFMAVPALASASDPVRTTGPGAAPLDAAPSGPSPTIVLYTMGNGDVVWQKFGHAALCVEYPPASRRQSLCYNYGTTDFSDPVGVGWGFLRGEGRFWVSVTTLNKMIPRYISFDRSIWKQVLPISADEARAIAAKLAHDSLPENRYYTYHHFYDNCTTRLRDIIDDATGGKLNASTATTPGPSFRDFSRQGFAQDTWLLMLTDYLLGRGADVRPDLWQAMFLPRYLREQVREHFGAEPVLVYQRRGAAFSTDEGSGRGWLVLLAFALALPLAVSRFTGRLPRTSVAVASVGLFLMALIMWFLAVVTAVHEFRYNEALLLYWPTDIALPFLRPRRRQRYAQVRLAMVILTLMLSLVGVFVQPLWAPALVVLLPMIFLALSDRRASAAAAANDAPANKANTAPAGGPRRPAAKGKQVEK